MHLLRYVVKYTVTDSPFNTQTSCLKCPPSAWIHFLTCVTRGLVTLRRTAPLLMLLAALRIRWSSSLVWASLVNKMLRIIWGLELIQQHNSNWLHMSAGSRCWMRWIRYGYIPSVCNVHHTLRVEVNTSGLNSRANSESETSYCIHAHGSDLQWLLSLEQLKCSSSFYPQCIQLPFMGSW